MRTKPAGEHNLRFMKRLFVGLATTALLWGGVAGVVGPHGPQRSAEYAQFRSGRRV